MRSARVGRGEMEGQIVGAVVAAIVAIIVVAAIGMGASWRSPSAKCDLRAQPRWLQKLKAEAGGFFWLPCPMCGESFGGHEWAGLLQRTPTEGRSVCANCAENADQLNREHFPDMYRPNVAHFNIGIKPRAGDR